MALTKVTGAGLSNVDGPVGIGIDPDTISNGKAVQVNRTVINDDDGGSLHIAQNGYYNSAWKYVENGTAEKITFASGAISFSNASSNSSGADASLSWSERMRVDADGNLLVAKSSSAIGTKGVELKADGKLHITSDESTTTTTTNIINRKSAEGHMLEFRKDNANRGYIGGYTTSAIYIGSGDTGIVFRPDYDSIYAVNVDNIDARDNAVDLGYATVRWDDIYATNGTIQTSDENEKQNIASFTTKELAVATKLSALFKTFKWKDKVIEKADKARTHSGIVAQQVKTAFASEGLDATKYGLFTSHTWTNDDGKEQTRMGVRYPELFSFIFGSIEARLTALEAK